MVRSILGGDVRNRARGRRAGFALRDLLATVCCLWVTGTLGCLAVNEARESARRNGCLSNIRQLGLGFA